jgi:4-hydroxy-3-methylbut-2-enyl diphosphate reductase
MRVVKALESRGAVFVQELEEVPEGAVTLFSAHGVSRAVVAAARDRGLMAFDAVCPLVRKVHEEVARHHRDGRHVLLIGHEGHPEVDGTVGQLPRGAVTVLRGGEGVERLGIDPPPPVAFAVQTTFSTDEAEAAVSALRRRFSDIAGPRSSDICYATTNRQAAVKTIAPQVEAMLVAGDPLSSNAARLAEVASLSGCARVQLVAGAAEIAWDGLGHPRSLGITAAASAPDEAVEEIIAALAERFDLRVEDVPEVSEPARFKPLELA